MACTYSLRRCWIFLKYCLLILTILSFFGCNTTIRQANLEAEYFYEVPGNAEKESILKNYKIKDGMRHRFSEDPLSNKMVYIVKIPKDFVLAKGRIISISKKYYWWYPYYWFSIAAFTQSRRELKVIIALNNSEDARLKSKLGRIKKIVLLKVPRAFMSNMGFREDDEIEIYLTNKRRVLDISHINLPNRPLEIE